MLTRSTATELWGLSAVLLVVLLVLLVRQRHVTTVQRRRIRSAERDVSLRDEELENLLGNRLPAEVDRAGGADVEVPAARHPELRSTRFGELCEALVVMVGASEAGAHQRSSDEAKETVRGMAAAVQSLAAEQQVAVSGMQAKHNDPAVLEGLLRIDHANSQLGRRAQVLAVLCGAWPGTQRSASELSDVVRGAVSRIRDYLRIEVRVDLPVAVVDTHVEPVVLAVAELLDNAARSSQTGTLVRVHAELGHNGVSVIIDDAGVGMTSEQVGRAAKLVSGREPVDIRRLGNPPQTGFAVCGVLVAKYGFQVSVDTNSPYGGVRAVVFVPNTLLVKAEVSAPVPKTRVRDAPGTSTPANGTTPNGLPMRRRHVPPPASTPVPEVSPASRQEVPQSAERTASAIRSWQRASAAVATERPLAGNLGDQPTEDRQP
ncbi:ATP-binding protein [Umezawaea endophytica]|uniref:histidine kinase n=1 Tax=Umezawaea endophytica TaxID=1654476 RepID=A0A9X3AIS2_9PSEU|nr:ATP-binding protein [Umezawaea endophytica]MCS7482941.1 ATP-binding protein [Umezawaea endophytica]